jgi:hypothetical protein
LKLIDNLKGRFIELSFDSIEYYYENINKELFDSYNKEIIKSEKNEIGIIKAKFARLISKKITTTKKFSKLFNNELNFLLETTANIQ